MNITIDDNTKEVIEFVCFFLFMLVNSWFFFGRKNDSR